MDICLHAPKYNSFLNSFLRDFTLFYVQKKNELNISRITLRGLIYIQIQIHRPVKEISFTNMFSLLQPNVPL